MNSKTEDILTGRDEEALAILKVFGIPTDRVTSWTLSLPAQHAATLTVTHYMEKGEMLEVCQILKGKGYEKVRAVEAPRSTSLDVSHVPVSTQTYGVSLKSESLEGLLAELKKQVKEVEDELARK